jgi:plasmid maintenance system antidote protein VapI
MAKVEPISKHQIRNLIKDCRKLINSYMTENNLTVHSCAKRCGVHPNQLYLFLNADRGLNLTTMQKIADVISN